ncbi:MAG: iron ABC transporter permease, partial [Cytophagaceae bacterium]
MEIPVTPPYNQLAKPGPLRRRLLLVGLIGLAIVFFLLDIALGSVSIPISEVARIMSGQGSDHTDWLYIVQKIRLPKAITAVIVGCGLSVSGLQMQTLFKNPLAGPSELGITAGAGLGVAVVMLSGGGS